MIILPAIDLIGGKCVRLKQGKYDDVTVYNDSPLDQAYAFRDMGAEWIHVVDLDAAKSGVPENHLIIKEIAEKTGLKVDTGGGIRNMDTLSRWIEDYGVSRAVLGTAAVKDPEFTANAIAKYGEKVGIGRRSISRSSARRSEQRPWCLPTSQETECSRARQPRQQRKW